MGLLGRVGFCRGDNPTALEQNTKGGMPGHTEKGCKGALGSAEGKGPEGNMFMQLLSSTHFALGCFIPKREPAS